MNGRGVRTGWFALVCAGVASVSTPVVGGAQTNVAVRDQEHGVQGEELLTRRVTLTLSHVSRRAAIAALSAKTHVVVQYQVQLFDSYTDSISLRVSDTPVGDVLEHILKGTSLRVVPDGVALAIVDRNALADGTGSDSIGTIAGQVIDSASGRSVAGAAVQVRGFKLATVTNKDGTFTLRNVPVGDQAVSVKLFGYRPVVRPVTVRADERSAPRFALTPAPNVLSGVLTTATGVQERRSLGNDITVINADSVMRTASIKSVTDLLDARVPGLVVERTSGIPGSPSRLRLRGIGGPVLDGSNTMSNDPILIVDGVRVYSRETTPRDLGNRQFTPPSAIDQIDVNTIDKIEVFKGPSATSQWGADAANGVIVITTKRGRAGPTRVNGSLSAGMGRMPGTYAAPGYYLWGHNRSTSGPVFGCNPLASNDCAAIDSVVSFQAVGIKRLSIFGTGNSQDAAVTVSGGVPTLQYSLTGSGSKALGYAKMPDIYQDIYETQYGNRPPGILIRPDRYQTWGTGASLSANPWEKLHVSVFGSLYNSQQKQTSGQSVLSDLSSRYIDTVVLKTVGIGNTLKPYTTRGFNESMNMTAGATADVIEWNRIQLNARVGFNDIIRSSTRTARAGIASDISDSLGYYGVLRGESRDKTLDFGATVLPGRIVQTVVGANIATESTFDLGGLNDSLARGFDIPTTLRSVGQSQFSVTKAGWYVEPRLNLNSRFFVNPGLRFDGGNAMSGSGQSGGRLTGGLLALFPRLNFSWIALDRQDERPLAGFLSVLRPRVAFGIAGVQPDPGANLRTYAVDRTDVTAPVLPGISLRTIGNTRLHPERTRELEGGFDADVWGQRVQLGVTHYSKLRVDAILPVSLAASLGGYQYMVNAGRIRNTGTELSLNAQVLNGDAARWNVNATYAANQNKVLSLVDNLPTGRLQDVIGNPIVAGYPLGGWWARPILGYSDPNDDGRLTLADVAIGDSAVYLGNSLPRYETSMTSDLVLWHGSVTVNAALTYENGVTQGNFSDVQRLINMYLNPNATLGEQAAALAAYACNNLTYISPCSGPGTNYGVVQTVNTLRFKSFSVSYAVPASMIRTLRLPHTTIAVQGDNLGLWTNYRGKDPDVNSFLGGEQLGDKGELPLPRTWSLRITFDH